jgi:hypothetical protein
MAISRPHAALGASVAHRWQLEPLLGSSRKREIADLVVGESGGTTLAPKTDPRPLLLSGAAADFAALPRPLSP